MTCVRAKEEARKRWWRREAEVVRKFCKAWINIHNKLGSCRV